ncbi:MAG: primosomal protein N' [Lachnospiraceae bacterium]|nr:primosomal protein N' [Lachnospiraceae bacterium]
MDRSKDLENNAKYADVIIDVSIDKLDRPFSYRIPERLSGIICVGSRVRIPFGGGNVEKKGYVTAIRDSVELDDSRIKDITGIIEESVSAQDMSFEIAAYIKNMYGGTLSQALKVVIPAKAKAKPIELKTLVRKMDKEQLISLAGEAARKKQHAKEKLYLALIDNERIPSSWITSKLGISSQTVASVVKSGAAFLEISSEYRKPAISDICNTQVALNDGQEKIVNSVSSDMEEGLSRQYLIHGVTGSGKTEVYLRLAEKAVMMGKQVIFLIPEIALTYQTLARFYGKFGDRVSVLNSSMSPGERFDQCERAKNGDIDIIIGPRSALFTPFPNVGLIIMDEEHESSYKSESTPKYHAREVAARICEMTGASFVMGSATPSLESYTAATSGKVTLFELTERAGGGELASTEIIDLRKELSSGNRSMFSRRLKALMDDRMAKGEQIMLFLNRRGFSGQISCRECGKVIMCPHCEVPMSLHKGSVLICHYCGETREKPAVCPSCGSKYLAAIKAGTEQVEESVRKLYPEAGILRMDKDTTKEKGAYDRILSSFSNGEAQILIGTQMIVKGHDFPNVTLVGILVADLSLGVPDYRAAERTFQLLAQAAGRAGRGEKPGNAVIQTYQPDSYAIKCAAEQDYVKFYEEEMAYRETAGYPPALHLLAIQFFGLDDKKTSELARGLADVIKSNGAKKVLGPAPANIAKVKDYYRHVIYIKDTDEDALAKIRSFSEEYLDDKDMNGMFVQFDLDPVNQI